jgi:uncharacterized damage-inducible protein DinB
MPQREYAAWVQPFAASYDESRAEAARLARALPGSAPAAPTGNTGWTAVDELAHLADAGTNFAAMLREVTAGGVVDTARFADIDASNARGLFERRGRPLADIAAEIEKGGEDALKALSQLRDADQERRPPGVPFTLGQLLQGYAQHDSYHLAQARDALTSVGVREAAG